ncbi:MAG TPA: efflux RND transporter periplasmic adaptor subunit [Nitrospiraceae bacterium]|nr:efflux RND transporter periplasmic adaptor subunit [Nitrospiraceae bacterium]
MPMSERQLKRRGLTWAMVLGTGLALALMIAKLGTKADGRSGELEGARPPVPLVEVAPVTVEPVAESLSAVGTLQAVASVMIRPELAGLVRRIAFVDGQKVAPQDVLFELDQEELRAELGQAEAQEKIARLTYERLKRLSGQQTTIISPQQLDEARSAWQAAEANSVLYRTRLKKTVIRAPFAGTVGLRRVSAGDYVAPGQDLVNLEDLRMLHVDFKVPEGWLSKVAVGQWVGLLTDAYPDRLFQGEVSAVDPRLDSVNRTVALRAAVPNQEGALRPGLFVTVRLLVREEQEALMIPEEAVLLKQGRPYAFRYDGSAARLTEVTLGVRQQGLVQVLSGLSAGDQVVRTGTHKLSDGMAVATQAPEES